MPTGNKDDKNQDFDADYDFSKMDFGDDGADDQKVKSSATLADDDDVFAGFGGGNDASGDFGSDDDNFEFEDMPDPNKPMATAGNVDDEFADIAAAPATPARATVAPASSREEPDPFADEGFETDHGDDSDDFGDEFDHSDEDNDETVTAEDDDLFNADGDDTIEDADENAASGDQRPAASRSGIMKFAFPIAAVLGVCAIGYAAYSYVTPMIFGSPAPQQHAQTPLPPASANFPTKLPSQGLPPPAAQNLPAPMPPPQQAQIGNSMPIMNPPANAPAIMPPAAPPVQQPQMAQQIPAPTGFPGGIVLPDTIQPPAPKASVPEDDLVAGGDRGGIAAMKEAASRGSDAGTFEKRFAMLEAQVDGLKKRIDSLTDRIESGTGVASVAKTSNDDTLVAETVKALPDDIVPPLKPVVIEGVSLKGVSRDVAWVSTVSGVVEVKEGDNIPNAGDVVKVRSYAGDWIVVTTQGIVVR